MSDVLARMLARMSVSVSWNSIYTVRDRATGQCSIGTVVSVLYIAIYSSNITAVDVSPWLHAATLAV